MLMSLDWFAAALALSANLWLASAVWLLSLPLRNAGIVDSFWALFFVVSAGTYAENLEHLGPRAIPIALMLGLWALRLCGHITLRNWGRGEDRRYQAIRARNQPHYWLKSLLYVFALQALLAWMIALPLFAALSAQADTGWLDGAGILVWLIGFGFESTADYQLARFKADAANAGKVMDAGLWRYSRHPNYFGEALVWWGFWLMAAAAGSPWTIVAPILITFMLLKVSGVALLEQDIHERRPGYADYVRRTNAFLPGLPKAAKDDGGPR